MDNRRVHKAKPMPGNSVVWKSSECASPSVNSLGYNRCIYRGVTNIRQNTDSPLKSDATVIACCGVEGYGT